jgi:hypothetical protein
LAARIRELCDECEELVNHICENETDISVLQSFIDMINDGQRQLGKLRGKIISRATKLNARDNSKGA